MKFVSLLFLLGWISFSDTSQGKPLKIGMKKINRQFYPVNQAPGDSNFIRNLVVPPVIAINQNQEWTCIVCESIPSIEKGSLEVTDSDVEDEQQAKVISHWELSDNFFWDDGKPVTGFDVKFTLDQMRSSGFHLPYEKIVINHKNPRKFSISFSDKRTDFFQVLAISLLPHQKSKLLDSFKGQGSSINNQLAHSKGLSYGPYRIKASDDSLLLSENTFYKGLKNDFKEMKIYFLRDLQEIELALQRSAVDMIADGELPYSQIKTMMRNRSIKSKWKLAHSLSPTVDILNFNLKNPYLADQRIRKAILYSIDRESLLSDIFDNYGAVAPIPPFEKEGQQSTSSYRLIQAGKILTASGWSMVDGIRSKNGARLILNLIYHKTSLKQKIANRIRSNLGAAGIVINLKPQTSQKSVSEKLQKGLYRDLALISMSIYPKMPLVTLFHSDYIPQKLNGFTGHNFGFWSNKRVDRLMDKIDKSLSDQEREIPLRKFSSIYQEDLPAVPLLIRPHFAMIHSNLVNVHFPRHGYHSSLFSSGWSTMEDESSIF